jgi:hypothetical protein
MSGRSGKLLIAAAAACLALGMGAGGQDPAASPEGDIRTFFTSRSAVVDESLPVELAGEFEKDEGAPLMSVTIDLDGDGRPAKFVLSGALSGSGGRQWLVYDPVRNVSRGIVIGSIIFVTREDQDGFPVLETYWKQGGEMAVVFRYACSRGRYGRVHSRSLTVQEISDYFRDKPALDEERELVEIKGGAAGPPGRA